MLRFIPLFALLAPGCVAPPLAPADDPPADLAIRPPRVSTASMPAQNDGGLTYVAYVRSFQDSDGDGIGDLPGVASRLDYLEGLGVQRLWLLPVFPASSATGYDVLDLDGVRAEYGGDAALAHLVADAHDRGIDVWLDTPVNATSAEAPAFMRALADPTAPERADYVFSTTSGGPGWHPAGTDWYYGYEGPTLPDRALATPEGEADLTDRLGAWLGVVDGLHLHGLAAAVEADGCVTDCAGTRDLVDRLATGLRAAAPEAILSGASASASLGEDLAYLGDDHHAGLDLVLDPARSAALLDLDPDGLLAVVAAEGRRVGRTAPALGGPDLPRLPSRVPDVRARRAMFVIHLLSPGVPLLYYGEELDLPDATGSALPDAAWRGPMQWADEQGAGFTRDNPWFPLDPSYRDGVNVAEELEDPASMLSLVKALGELRAESVALQTGTWTPLAVTDVRVLAVGRDADGEQLRVLVNTSAHTLDAVAVDLEGDWLDLTAESAPIRCDWPCELTGLGPYAYRVWARGLARTHSVPASDATSG